jgi:rhodanese-related sulfurtransferase
MKFIVPLLLLAAAVFLLSTRLRAADAAAFRNVSVEEFDRLRADKNTVVLDVRTDKEVATGRLPGAVHLDWNGPDFAKEAAKLDPAKTYLVYCAAGGRSASACKLLSGQLGFKNCVNLQGGITAWKKAAKPVEKP